MNNVISVISNSQYSPGWCGSVDWALACETKTHWSVPNQCTCLDYRPGPWLGVLERQPHIDVSLLLVLPPFPFL